jgi:hypothetical protein
MAALTTETDGPGLDALLPSLDVRLEEWTENGVSQRAPATPEALSDEMWSLYAPRAEPDDAMRALVRQVLEGVSDEPEAKARTLYEWACRSIQYCAIEVGYGGWVPHAATEVQRTGYGDCKDKATHLLALLRLAGVEAWPTLIYAHDGVPRSFGLPSMGSNFNHAILAVRLPGRTVYADPTHRAVPFGQLPVSDQGALVLELRPGGASLERTRDSTPEENQERQHYALTLRADGDAEGVATIAASGARAQPIKQRFIAGTGLAHRWLEGRLWARDVIVSQVTPPARDDFAPRLQVSSQVLVRRAVASAASRQALVRPVDLLGRSFVRVSGSRKTPLLARSAEQLEAVIELALPAGTVVGALPAPVSLENAVGAYSLSWAVDGTRLTLTRTVRRAKRQVPVALLAEANALAEASARAEATPVLVRLGAGGAP